VRREYGTTNGSEAERVHLDTKCRNVLLLKLSSQMTLDKGRLSIRLSAWILSSSLVAALLAGTQASWTATARRQNVRSGTHLSCTTVTDKDKLEGGCRAGVGHGCRFVVVAGVSAVGCAKAAQVCVS
jgi:hypothetical protein